MNRNRLTALCVIGLAALAASACGSSTVSTGSGPGPAGHGQTSILPNTTPAQAYTMVARQIKACWFKPSDPVLTKHIFRAESPPGRNATTTVVIYGTGPDGRRGLKSYTIDFEPRSKGTLVKTANLKLPYALAQKLTGDVGYWVQGGANCDGPTPTRTGPDGRPVPRGSY